jgi:hypothetical protein
MRSPMMVIKPKHVGAVLNRISSDLGVYDDGT